MNELDSLLATTLADPLGAARAHAAAGGRVIGYYTCNVPVELILAAGAFPVHLPHRTDGATPLADRYMEPLFDRALRSAFDRWLAGDFAFIEAVILPRSQDSAQRVYYYVDELIRTGEIAGPRPRLFDLLKIPRASSEAYTAASTRRIGAELGVTSPRLRDAIEQMNVRRRMFARLEQRMAEGCLPDSPFASRVLAAGLYAARESFDHALESWLDEPPSRARSGRRVALVGSAQPDDRLQRAIEGAGGIVVGEHHLFGPGRHGPVIDAGESPLDALARSYHAHVASVRDFGAPLASALAQTARLDGVVLWLTEEDDALAWQAPSVVAAARTAGLPLLSLTRQDWLAGGPTLAAIREFVAGVDAR